MLGAQVMNDDIFACILFREVCFALYKKIDRFIRSVIEFFDRILVAGEPELRFILPEYAACPTDEQIVIRVFVWMKFDDASDSREDENQSKDGV